MSKKALIIWGGWDGHTPKETAAVLAGALENEGFKVRVEDNLDCLTKVRLKQLDLIVPVWTMGEMTQDQTKKLNEAVRAGVGFAGVHGGMGDAFRGNLTHEWMTGGMFVGHPHVGSYTVRLTEVKSPITKGMKSSFKYDSEQYYMMTDPGNKVLAVTTYKYEGQNVTMPVVWTKTWGKGRVFYSSLGHVAEEFSKYPDVLAMTVRGMKWAADGKALAGKKSTK